MKKVFALQLSDFAPSAVLPQAIGSLLGYVFQNKTISENFEISRTFWENETFEQVISEIEQPDVLLCSCYVWNWDRTQLVIQHIRNKYPNCLIIVGGPEPEYNSKWLEKHGAIDILIPYYGEEALENVLTEFNNGGSYLNLPGVITRNHSPSIFPKPNFSKMISPYLNGYFNTLIKSKRPETTSIRAVFESNRGCPFSCTFCDIGSKQYTRIHAFDLEISFKELEWMVINKIDAIDVADANFGILPRDEKIVEKLVDLKTKHNWKGRFLPTWSKVKGDRVLRIAKKIIQNELDSVFGLSLQSLSQKVLINIKRKNAFNLSELSEITNDLNKNNVPVYTEVIFPLPGESLKSFKDGIHSVLDMENVFDKFQVNQLSRYNNAQIASPDQTKKFDISWKQVRGFTRHYYGNNSQDTIAISTKDITKEEVFEGLFYVKSFIIPLYFYGILRRLVDNLQTQFKLEKSTFFINLYDYLHSKTWFNSFKSEQRNHYFSAIAGETQFGQILTSDHLDFFPEYSIAHQFYLNGPIYNDISQKFPEFSNLITFCKNSVWLNKAEEEVIEIVKSKKIEKWLFADKREMKMDDYYKQIYISGRFDRRWEKQTIKRV